MRIKELMVGTVTLATVGLSACKDTGGAVDPAPTPFQCDSGEPGASLTATGFVSGSTLTIVVTTGNSVTWKGTPTVTSAMGATLDGVIVSSDQTQATITLQLASPTTTTGTVTVQGTVSEFGSDCPVTRTFMFTRGAGDGGSVTVAELDDTLPLERRDPATIVVLARRGRDVDVTAKGATGTSRIEWTPSAGMLTAHADGRVTWRLPPEPGLYQLELLVDHGRQGLAIDTLTLEVQGA